jgi:hypothetical protein
MAMDDLRQENKRLKKENHELRERLAAAEAKIKQLVELLAQNSHNSNWPSSHDKDRRKRKSKSLRPKTDRKAGGQTEHKGYTLEFNPNLDVIETYRPLQWEHCQAPFGDDIVADLLAAKQQVDEACDEGKTALSSETIERIHQLYDTIVTFGFSENPLPKAKPPPGKRGKLKKSKARNLVERFEKHKDAILRFIHDFKVPFCQQEFG